MDTLKNSFDGGLRHEQVAAFEALYAQSQATPGGFIEYTLPYPKHAFLDFLVKEKGLLLHGSNHPGINELEPRQANCRSKKFGNLNAVYAVEDSILPIFFAIRVKQKMPGMVVSGFHPQKDGSKSYEFSVSSQAVLDSHPWSEGVIYILPRASFEQGTDDDGNPIDEFASRTPVKAVAKLQVAPADFPYLDQVGVLKE